MEFSVTLAPKPEPEALDRGTALFRQNSDFLKGVVAMSGMPPSDRIEVCFAGRSNVGKSSLINALTGRRALARTSNTPGRTQEINFFTLAESHYLVDVPGYGFANAPLPIVQKWQALLKAYLSGRPSLRRVFLLIDARHGPKEVDREIMALLTSSAVTFQIVLTKIDKIKADELKQIITKTSGFLQEFPSAFPTLIATSSAKGAGLDTLRAEIAAFEA